MQNLAVVAVLERQADLREPVQDLILREVVLGHLRLALVPSLKFLDLQRHVAAISVVHHDAELALLRLVHLLEADDVRVVEHLKNLCFSECRLLVILAHLLDVNLFDHGVGLAKKNSQSSN